MRLVAGWLLMFMTTPPAWAYPELTRHGYTQCTACHVAPGGGGVLTPYGRQLSEELLSRWSRPGEGQLLHGAVKWSDENKWLFGGDVRSIQTHRKTSTVKSGRFFLMQAQFEAAYTADRFTAVVAFGQIENPMSGRVEGNLNAGRYYGLLNIDDHWAVRAGRFTPQFGLNLPDHVLVTKQGIGFAPQRQFDTIELSRLSESWSLFAGLAKTTSATAAPARESAANIQATYHYAERFKVGGSAWRGERANGVRQIYGLHTILGFTHRLYSLNEVSLLRDPLKNGMFAMTRWGYEVTRGFIPYLQLQRQHTDLERKDGVSNHYTIGAQFFPRPHFELSSQWTKVRSPREWSDEAYLLVHYYF